MNKPKPKIKKSQTLPPPSPMKRMRRRLTSINFETGECTHEEYNKVYIGIDNGVSGAITVLSDSGVILIHLNTPVNKHLNYTKKKAFMNRVDFKKLRSVLINYPNSFCMIERPMVNPMRWVASVSALRCLEATEILLELLEIPYQFIDSKEWQKALLPSGLKGDQLKKAAKDVAKRLFPKQIIVNADSLLIAEHCRRVKR